MKYNSQTPTIYTLGACSIDDLILPSGLTAYGHKEPALQQGQAVMPLGVVLEKISEAQDKRYLAPWQKITPDEWEKALCELPPEKWQNVCGVDLFRCCEYITSNITRHFARVNDTCYTKLARTSTPFATLAAEITAICPEVTK